MKNKISVLFVCTHNSARSQMAEALLNSLYGDRFIAYSAGTEPSGVSPYAVKVMKEVGVDISGNKSKHVSEFSGGSFDYVVTVCDSAKESCPFFPGAKKFIHKSFPNPVNFRGGEDEKILVFRRVRDEIRDWIKETFD